MRIAVQTGSALVPVLSFGENNMYLVAKPEDGTFTARLQRCPAISWIYRLLF